MKTTTKIERPVRERKLSFYDTPRDRELLDALEAAFSNIWWRANPNGYKTFVSRESHIKHLLELVMGLSTSNTPQSFGLEQWPPRLVEAIRKPRTPADRVEKKQSPAHAFLEERGRILPFTPRVAKCVVQTPALPLDLDAGAELE